jgi:hypothetical protein
VTGAFDKKRVGEVRPSQVMHTFGIGALVDLPNFSAVVMGLGDWDPPAPENEISEPRLLSLVKSHLGPQVERLIVPPVASGEGNTYDPFDPDHLKGIPVSPFPNWVRCPNCDLIAPVDNGLFKLRSDPRRPDRTRFVHVNCNKGREPMVVPVRFVRACENGHLNDFPWFVYVHGGPTNCKGPLRIREFGVSAEAADIVVMCDAEGCEASKPMTLAYGEKGEEVMGPCAGNHPHLRHTEPNCQATPKATLAGASNLWFPVNITALHIPEATTDLGQLVEESWGFLKDVTSKDILGFLRKQDSRMGDFAEWDDDEIWASIEELRGGNEDLEEGPRSTWELKDEEWHVFTNPDSVRQTVNFRARAVAPPPGYESLIEQVVLIERLRVVNALIGFTRIISPGDFADVSEIPEIRRVPIARARPDWVPASEVRGEGIFIRFREDAIEAWLRNVRDREQLFLEAHTAFRRARNIDNPSANFPGIRYVLIHSLSHALIRQLSIECGYSAASLQERIYASDGAGDKETMAGILLYTAAADSEGTLGGLVSLGEPRNLARHLDRGLEEIRLCASDPLCSEHEPGEDGLNLHGSSCHACLFASETSCERGNKYLDRTLLVRTIGGESVPFFEDALAAVEAE